MLISEIGIKGFRSFGNNEQVVKLNTEKGELILLVGGNGNGKSVKPSTEIEVEIQLENFDLNEIRDFMEIMDKEIEYVDHLKENNFKLSISIDKLNKLQNKIDVLEKHTVKVLTQSGFKKIKAVGITSPNSEKIEITTKDFSLSGSPSHRVKYLDNWFFLKDIKIGDKLNTKNGIQEVISIEEDHLKEDLWDIEVDGSEYYSNGILSHNSSFLSSFEYVLYNKVRSGKSKKWSSLSTLPNRINGELLNRIKFKSNGVDVEVKRGISPNKLELWENGVLNDKAGKANIDDRIEEYVGMDIETFKSFISMSIDSFKNFISLSNEEKQLLLDKLFNLEVINVLNGILKDINKNNKIRMASLDAEIRTLDESISSIKASIEKAIQKEKLNIQSEIDEIMEDMNSKKEDYVTLKEKVEKIREKGEILINEIEKEKKQFITLQGEVKTVQREIDLYDSGKCPTCATDFKSEHFEALRSTLLEKKNGLESIKNEVENNIKLIKEKQIKLKEIENTTTSTFNDISYFLKNCKVKIDQLNRKKESQNSESVNIEEFQKTIDELNVKKGVSSENVALSKEKELYYKELNRLFGEDGVKRAIIAGIIKPINHFISENISKMGLPFDVKLDETFTASIKQLGNDIDTDTLSTGEQKLTNICILCAYLKLIRTKKYINILFLDEVFSSIDLENISKILDLLKSFANEYNINIFVVHHAVLNQEIFDRIIQIDKNVFSQINEMSL